MTVSDADPGEVNFHLPPFSEPPSFIFSYPTDIEIIFDFSDIITNIHPPLQNPGSAPEFVPVNPARRTDTSKSFTSKSILTGSIVQTWAATTGIL